MNCFYPLTILQYMFLPDQFHSLCFETYQHVTYKTTVSFHIYLIYFVTTLLLEILIYFYFFYQNKLTQMKSIFHFLNLVLILNLASHPLIFWVVPYVFNYLEMNTFVYILTAEALAISIETLILKFIYKNSWKKSIVAAFLANIFSWSVGVWFQTLGLL